MRTKKSSSSDANAATKPTNKPREKKAYSLPGQKHDVPEEREPLRLFYESLSRQIPSSEMAEFWMMEHGLLSPDRAKKAYEKKQMKQKQLRTATPTKSPSTSDSQITKGLKNGQGKTQKRASSDDSDNDDDDDDSSDNDDDGDDNDGDRLVLSKKRRKA